MACSKCGKNKTPLQRGRMAGKPGGISITGQLNPHNITERQGIRKQRLEEQKREIRSVPGRNATRTNVTRPKRIRKKR